MNVYEVEFREYWDKESHGGKNTMSVAAKSGEAAIEKVKNWALKQTFKDEEKPSVIHKCTSFQLLSLRFVTELDL